MLATLSFLPGMAIATVLFDLTAEATQLPMSMTAGDAVPIFGLTLAMCVVSGSLALRKLRSADPAEVF